MADTQKTAATYKEYKSTYLDYVAVTPRHWSLSKLKFISSIANGATPLSSIASYWNGDILWATPTDISQVNYIQETERYITYRGYLSCGTTIVPAGSIVLTTRAPIGNIAIAASELCTNQGCKALTINDGLSKKYFYFYLASVVEKLKSLGTGTTFMELSTNELRSFIALVPPLIEQRAIANYLESQTALLDKAISTKERQIELLKERKQMLIQQAITRGLSPDAPMRESGIEWIGEMPAHWQSRRFKYLFSQSQLPVRSGDGVVTSYRDGQVTLRSNRRLTGYTEAILEGGYQGVRRGQLVLNSMDAFEGAIGVSESDGKCTPEYIVCDSLSNDYLPEYFAYLLREMALARYIQVICNAVRQRAVRIRFNNLATRLMAVPPIEEQREIVKFIKIETERQDSVVALFEQQITKLKEYKATLINSAVTGKIKVPGVVEPTEIEEREFA
ncbi:restriction endonuclease subunit S [Pseudomonas sp. GLN_6]|uniref:restriction endonuclease subunit S n=1 Tax=Pseudomonas sp. GLN_6 TaxID=3367183 RepID=UPI00370CB560